MVTRYSTSLSAVSACEQPTPSQEAVTAQRGSHFLRFPFLKSPIIIAIVVPCGCSKGKGSAWNRPQVIVFPSAFGMIGEVMAKQWCRSKMQGNFFVHVCAVIPVPEAGEMLLFLAH